MGLDDFAPAPKAADDLDVDLFDFPPMVLPEPPQAEVSEEPKAQVEVARVETTSPARAEAPKATPADGCTGLDPELDVDLFDFPPIDLSSIGITPAQTTPSAIEESIDSAAQSVSDFLEDDLGDMVQTARAEQAPLVPVPQAAPAPAVAPAAAPAAATAIPQTTPVPVAAPVAYTPIAVAGPSPKALWVLTAAVILFMVGLLGIAWRATSSFQQQIQQVRSDVQASTKQLQATTTSSIKELAEVENALLLNQINASKSNRDARSPQKGLDIQDPHTVTLAVATNAIEMGHYSDARRMLFSLLAEADGIPSTAKREEMERQSLFLIANSHKLEAQSLTGDDK
jgi:hypothetical protein